MDMDEVNTILQHTGKIERVGKEVRTLAEDLRIDRSIEETKKLAYSLYAHEEVAVNMVAVFLFGILASQTEDVLTFFKDDESEYVRKSAGNALRDISRKHKDLVAEELRTWDTFNKRVLFTYELASKFLS